MFLPLTTPSPEFSVDFDYRVFSRNYMVGMDTNQRFPLLWGTCVLLPFPFFELFNCLNCSNPVCLLCIHCLMDQCRVAVSFMEFSSRSFRKTELWTQLFLGINSSRLDNLICSSIQNPHKHFCFTNSSDPCSSISLWKCM